MVPVELTLTLGAIAVAVDGRLAGRQHDRVVSGFSIDTRTLQPGDLFFAIRGDRFDGHAFVADAVRAGASGAVVSDPAAIVPAQDETALIVVTDVIAALQALARHLRRASRSRVVAVTGSAGKSTTKEIAADFLSARYRVFRSMGI